jgi:predicted ATPase/class 3 adenylate cyclase
VGTEVFLFTDIEGSTRLWAEYPAGMARVLAAHDALLANAVAEAGGTVFKHTGDGMCAVFPSVSGGLWAAAAAQRAFFAMELQEIVQLRVRMAVHAGGAEHRGDDWFGPALNRTARILALAHGGQVLVSAAAYELACDTAVKGLSFLDRGSHRLRDLEHPEHAWQLLADGLERDFPPLRSFETPRKRLPTYLTPFVGRGDELAMLRALVDEARIVTLVGSGGAGKTRLAAEAGAALIDRFPDGVWMFELAGLTSADGLEASMSSTLGLSEVSGLSPADVLFDTLAAWRALLIIDNCEHLTDAVARLVERLVSTSLGLVVLTTSREPLCVAGEHVVTVGAMAADDAVRLFADRAAGLHHTSSPYGLDNVVVGRICERLDHMPLAIELAAARTVAMTPAEIEARLSQRFDLLTTRSGDRSRRHASLERVVDWSDELLDADHQALFVRLGVFAGSFDAHAAHRVCWPDDDLAALGMLEDLVAKSLLTVTWPGDHTSYRMLETMRQYGARHIDATEWERLQNRHADFFAALADEAWDGCRGPQSQYWMDLIDGQLDNFRAAIELAFARQYTDWAVRIAAGLFMYNHTQRLTEVFGWVERSLGLPDALDHPQARAVRLHQAYGYTMSGDLDAAVRLAEAVLATSPGDGDALKPLALTMIGTAFVMGGKPGGVVSTPPPLTALPVWAPRTTMTAPRHSGIRGLSLSGPESATPPQPRRC